MAPPLKGTIHTHTLADGTRAFHLRVRFRGERMRIVLHELDGCTCGCGGSWDAPAARTELGNIQAKIRVGVWQRFAPAPSEPFADGGPVPLFRTTRRGGWRRRSRARSACARSPEAPRAATAHNCGGQGAFGVVRRAVLALARLLADDLPARRSGWRARVADGCGAGLGGRGCGSCARSAGPLDDRSVIRLR